MKLQEAIEKVMSEVPTADTGHVATQVLKIVPIEELVPLLSEYLAGMLRDRTREIERSAFINLAEQRTGTLLPVVRPSKDPDASKLAKLAKDRFARGDGSEVAWLQATKSDHNMRISYLDSMRRRFNDGINDTISRHRKAIEIIEAHGVTCLADIAKPALAVST